MNKVELLWDSSSSDSDSCHIGKLKKHIKQSDFIKAPVKIEEILAFSDSDSENYKEIGVMDLTYEEFLARKHGFSEEKQKTSEKKFEKEAQNPKNNKKDIVTQKIKELQNELSFQEANKTRKNEEKIFRSSDGKIKEKHQEIAKDKSPLMVKKNLTQTYFQELEDLK